MQQQGSYIDKMNTIEKILVKLQLPSLKNKVVFFRLMAISQKAGLGMRETILLLIKSEKHPGMRKILEDILIQVNQGLSLYNSLKNHDYFFSMEEIELIKSSETIGNMPEVLQNIADELENYQRIKSKMKNALTYPLVVLFIAAGAIVILLLKVMPVIVDLFPSRADLPGITQFMLGASDFLKYNWMYLILGVLAGISALRVLYTNVLEFKKLVDLLVLKVPVIRDVSQKFNLYRFTKLLGDFNEAGVSPTVALQQISDVLDNYHYKTKISDIKRDIELGLGFTDSMEEIVLFDPILVQIIGVGETTGNLAEVLQKMANFYREELESKIEGMTKLIEPLLMAFVAIIVGVIVASVFLPMGDLIGNIGQ